jgi:hypothetical protein
MSALGKHLRPTEQPDDLGASPAVEDFVRDNLTG